MFDGRNYYTGIWLKTCHIDYWGSLFLRQKQAEGTVIGKGRTLADLSAQATINRRDLRPWLVPRTFLVITATCLLAFSYRSQVRVILPSSNALGSYEAAVGHASDSL